MTRPVAYGVVLWPMVGIRIDHRIPNVVSAPPYTILELARVGLSLAWGLMTLIALVGSSVPARNAARTNVISILHAE